MSVGERLLGFLKITGLTALLFAGSICEGIGIPLHFVGKGKKAEAVEAYANSEEYQIIREAEDARIDAIEGKLANLEVSYQAGDILKPEYTALKKAYEDDIRDSEENFFNESLANTENEEVKGLLKSHDAYNISSIVLMVVGGLVYVGKGLGTIFMSIDNCYFTSPGTEIGEEISFTFECDVAPELCDFVDRKRRERQERKEAKEKEAEEKERQEQESFTEEEEENLGNIEDTCYRE